MFCALSLEKFVKIHWMRGLTKILHFLLSLSFLVFLAIHRDSLVLMSFERRLNLLEIFGIIRQARKIEFGIQQFSDSTLLYIPIDEGLENIVDEVVASWMGELARWILVGMSRGFMFRGAIAMGWGWEIRENCLTGPVVHEAYKLESEISKYPRVIFSRAVVDRFNYRRAYAESLGVDMSKIPTFLRLLRCDVDGVYMLDYLSELAREIWVTGETMNRELARQIYDTIFAAVGKMYLDFKERGDAKLAERYWRLISYIYDKKEVWVEEPKDK